MSTLDGKDTDLSNCRYCLEPITDRLKAVRPCNCNSYVHNKCLNQWNERREKNGERTQDCEICISSYAINKTTVFDRKRCWMDIFSVIYFIFSLLMWVFANPFALFGGTLFFDWGSRDNGGLVIMIVLITGISTVIVMMVCSITICSKYHNKNVAPIDYLNSKPILKFSTIIYYISFFIIATQGLSLIIANPILGRPIAFTPRGETFGVMLAILVGLGLVVLAIYGTVIGIRNYARKNWIKEVDVIIDK